MLPYVAYMDPMGYRWFMDYPLGMCDISIEKMAIEFVDLPIKHDDFTRG